MPTYNGSKYIVKQVTSILSQLSQTDELIISDDGSTDDTISLLKSFNDPRIKIFYHIKESSPFPGALKLVYLINRNMENAIKHASGDVIFMADQDDIWCANKVQRMLTELNDYDLVIHSYYMIDADDKPSSFTSPNRHTTNILQILIKPSFKGCCMAFNNNIKDHALPFPNYAVEHDTWIGLCTVKFGKIKYIDDKLIQYRRHGENVSPASGKSKNPLYIRLYRRWLILKAYCSLVKK